jgi:hypothetical protein
MPYVGFEHTIPGFERAKTVDALDRAATVTGCAIINFCNSIRAYQVEWGQKSQINLRIPNLGTENRKENSPIWREERQSLSLSVRDFERCSFCNSLLLLIVISLPYEQPILLK